MTSKINLQALWLIAVFGFFSGCQKEVSIDTGVTGAVFDLKIQFKPVVDGLPLQFNTIYQNHSGEPYTVKAFKFYICRIDLINTDANETHHLKNDHFLIDAADSRSVEISLKAGARKYNRIAFIIGVDSARNVSGAQTGALDPTKGMFWTWNSGYIMAKMEGSSPLSTAPNNLVEYHIGGFKEPLNVVKRVELSFPSNQIKEFLPGTTGTIEITANLNAWFHFPNDLRIASNPVCTTPGVLAKQIAENYAHMFTVTDILLK